MDSSPGVRDQDGGASALPVVQEHVQEAASLYVIRAVLDEAPHGTLNSQAALDERLNAHLDGLAVAAEHARPFCEAVLKVPSAGALFAAAIHALEQNRPEAVDGLLNIAEDVPEARPGLALALAWLEPQHLQGTVVRLLVSQSSFRRTVGIAACAAHGVDPGLTAKRQLHDKDPSARARAFRAAGELGRLEVLPTLTAALVDPDPECQFWAAWSAVLLGDRARALDALTRIGLNAESPCRARAFRTGLQVMTPTAAHATLQQFGGKPEQLRWLIEGSGINGDPTYVPWLIRHMSDEKMARLAGEAFTLITGADLDALQLWRERPEGVESGPTDNPDDEDVSMDPDDGLMWPDQQKVQKWWDKNGSRFQPGARYFMGAPVTREHCIQILKDGYQRQRILAAHYLCLLEPGTPLFNTSAPAWRQQKLLAQMA